MPFYSMSDPNFWDEVTSEPMREVLDLGKRAGKAIGLEFEAAHILMGTDLSAPQVTLLELPPGGVLDRHRHGCYRVEVIIRGSLDVDGKILGPGDVMISEPNDAYGPHTAGPEGVLTAEIFSRADAELVLEDPELRARYEEFMATVEA